MGRAQGTRDERLWNRLLALYREVDVELAGAMQHAHGLTLSEFRALRELAQAQAGELRMQELADAIGLNQSSVSRMVARLEGAGAVIRDVCPDDRRGVYAVITDEGRARLAAAESTYRRTLTAALDQAGEDPLLAPALRALRG